MRNMSFMLTTQQIYDETKTVTRRNGWWFLNPGDHVMACEKCQGLKKGERIVRIKPIEIVSTKSEALREIENYEDPQKELRKEGFPNMTAFQFILMYSHHNGLRFR